MSLSAAQRGLRLGIDLGGTKIAGVVLAADDSLCAERRVPTPLGQGYAEIVSAVVALIDALETDVGVTGLPVGIGLPGSVTPGSDRLRNANTQSLNGQPFSADIAAALGRGIRLANDANCLALSEARDGAGKGAESLFAIILGTGVGGGLVINGKPHNGRNGLAGEWGHIALPWISAAEKRQALRCWCGLEHCLETWLSGPAMSADHARRGGRAMSAAAIVARAQAGERLAGATLRAWLDRVARALAMVVNLLDPDVIVAGGGLSRIDWLYSEVPRIWSRHIFADTIDTPLRPARHGDASGVRGAARLWPLVDV